MSAESTPQLLSWVSATCGASAAEYVERLQRLWSGYGEIFRVRLHGGRVESAIVKWVQPRSQRTHPRGWSGDRSHQRKLRSYDVERAFYERFASRTHDGCRVPACYGATELESGWAFVLEDLDAAGFPKRAHALSTTSLDAALRWLAEFHATFLGTAPEGLWQQGTYWHLATRPDELEATKDPKLKAAAARLDRALSRVRYKTLVHGDAKVANLCFSTDGQDVAAVDFQYVGGGCGMKDVAYLLSSCLTERELLAEGDRQLDAYFHHLRRALRDTGHDSDALEREWRSLYPVAWADFARFLSGWAPGHWKMHGYTQKMVHAALASSSSR